MQRPFYTSFALLFLVAGNAQSQNRYGYDTCPDERGFVVYDEHYDCDYTRSRRPILDRLVGDFRAAGEQIDKGLVELGSDVRRLFDGGRRTPYQYRDDYREDYRQEALRRERFRLRELEQRRYEEFERRRQYAPPSGIRVPEEDRQRELESRSDERPPAIVRPRPNGQSPASPAPTPDPQPERPRTSESPAPVPEPDREPSRSDVGEPQESSADSRTFTEAEKRNFPLATKADKPGFVRSPYPPFELLDVSGLEAGGLAMEPDSDRIFRIPK